MGLSPLHSELSDALRDFRHLILYQNTILELERS